jgi:hypothetical protein
LNAGYISHNNVSISSGGVVLGNGLNVGGLVGMNKMSISTNQVNVSSGGVVSAIGTSVGGLVGYNYGGSINGDSVTISNGGIISGGNHVGGFIGYTNYGDGITGIDQVTTVGNGWAIYWQGIDYDEYIEQCEKINITPEIFRQ